MKPKANPNESRQANLFLVELTKIIKMEHPLVKLADAMDWQGFEGALDCHFSETDGAPAKPVRLMAGLHFLKHTYNLSDENTVERWRENPYWQYFCGRKYFEHEPPIDPSLMTRWRKMVGDGGMEKMLAETIDAGLRLRAINAKSLANVNVDTTVQEKAITYPTDAKLYHTCRHKLILLAKKHNVTLRQSYERVSKYALVEVGHHFHNHKPKLARRQIRKLKTWLGRVIRDISRNIAGNAELTDVFQELLDLSTRLYNQKKSDKNKIYSLHAPEVECISKGKAHKKYEFGNKASFVATSREGFVIGAQGLHGNPYDGHTLSGALEQAERLVGKNKIRQAFVDMGYRGHGYSGAIGIHICERRNSGKLPRGLRRLLLRRAAIEPLIGHMKNDGRLGRNYLLGMDGDRINVILCAIGQNTRLLLRSIVAFFCQIPNFWRFLQYFPVFSRRLAA